MLDFIRIGCAVPSVKPGDVKKNVAGILEMMEAADKQEVDLLVFPELAVTGYTCGDLFFQDTLWSGVKAGLGEIVAAGKQYPKLNVVVGLPVRYEGKLYNCAAFVSGGKLLGMVPKTYLSRGESRWFASGAEVDEIRAGWDVLDFQIFGNYDFGTDVLFQIGGVNVGVEICEDLFAPVPVSSGLALNGADIIVNPAASYETAGKRAKRRELVKHQSGAAHCIYAFVSAGCTESTTDMVYSGHSILAENGRILAENGKLTDSGYLLVQDCDVGRGRADRLRNETFRAGAARGQKRMMVAYGSGSLRSNGALYPVKKLPFIPDIREDRLERCGEIFQMQVTGLKQRLSAIGGANAVIGISGGLDSTLALLVAVEAMRQLGRPTTDVYGVTMPCFGTSDRTYSNSWELMRTLGINAKEINIRDAVSLHFKDIGHDPAVKDVTYENSQARERTQILMDIANQTGGLVIGTGDLSELALGWATYNGDHMSMYGVNGSVPKTLVRHLVRYYADTCGEEELKEVLYDVLDTPVSPELLPPEDGKIAQKTEDIVGPYELHDFFLYYILRFGYHPARIFRMAKHAFAGQYDEQTIYKWMRTFYWRFFAQQFKRSCLPDGPKVGSVAVSPRGDLRMPSDASAALWMKELDEIKPEEK